MRPAGFTLAALLLAGSIAWAQPPRPAGAPVGQPGGVPQVPGVAPPPPAAGVGGSNPKLDEHLAKWESTMGSLNNFRVELGLTRKDAVFQKARDYSGVVLCMKPNLAVLRLDYAGDPSKADYEAYICNGKSVYEYNGLQKTITEWKLPDQKNNPNGATDNLMLDFLTGMKAKDAKARFDLTLFKEDAHYVYLDIKPIMGRDKTEFQQLRLALYGPNTKYAYLPAQVFMIKPNGDSEQWKFTNPQTNLAGIDEKVFQFVKVDGFQFRQGQPPPPPAPPGLRPAPQQLPGAKGLPPGPGAIKP